MLLRLLLLSLLVLSHSDADDVVVMQCFPSRLADGRTDGRTGGVRHARVESRGNCERGSVTVDTVHEAACTRYGQLSYSVNGV